MIPIKREIQLSAICYYIMLDSLMIILERYQILKHNFSITFDMQNQFIQSELRPNIQTQDFIYLVKLFKKLLKRHSNLILIKTNYLQVYPTATLIHLLVKFPIQLHANSIKVILRFYIQKLEKELLEVKLIRELLISTEEQQVIQGFLQPVMI